MCVRVAWMEWKKNLSNLSMRFGNVLLFYVYGSVRVCARVCARVCERGSMLLNISNQ